MHETTTKDIHNHHKETQKQLQNYTHAHRPQTREKDGCTEWHNCEPTPHRLKTVTGWNQRIRIDHKDTHTKPQRDYKQTAKLNRLKILKGSKKWTRTDVETFGLCLRRFWLWCRRVLMCLPVHRPLVNTPINTEKPNQHFILHPLSVRKRFSSVRSFYFSCFLVHTRPSQTLF